MVALLSFKNVKIKIVNNTGNKNSFFMNIMDYLSEIIALSVDSILLGVSLIKYIQNKNAITKIQAAPYLDIDKNLNNFVTNKPDKILPYVIVRGTVQPIGNPITSNNNPKVAGVLQLLTIKEHIVQRGATGYWSEHEKVIQKVQNVMPFVLESNDYNVEVIDPLAADVLDLDVISNVFTPTVPKVIDHIWGFFTGFRQRGIQTSEEMLRKGSIITGVGELVANENEQSLRLQPPRDGSPFYLTNMGITSLVKKLEDNQKSYRLLCILFGTLGIVIGGFMLRKYFKDKSIKLDMEKKKKQLEITRKQRRKEARGDEMPDSQLCVVCRANPREVILLPCGHVCLCEDCSDEIFESCPICREIIEKRTAAYLS